KLLADRIVHKARIKAVAFIDNDITSLLQAYDAIRARHQRKGKGVIICEKVSFDQELFLGVKFDEQFGFVLMFGAGGTGVESKKDVSRRLIPEEASELPGFRGQIQEMIVETAVGRQLSQGQINCLTDSMFSLCVLTQSTGAYLITELDINPLVFAEEDRLTALDGRLKFKLRKYSKYYRAKAKEVGVSRDLSGFVTKPKMAVVFHNSNNGRVGRTAASLELQLMKSKVPYRIIDVPMIGPKRALLDMLLEAAIPSSLDFAFICTWRDYVGPVLRALIKSKAKEADRNINTVIISGGFGESETGKEADQQLRKQISRARRSKLGLSILGPNTMGIYTGRRGYSAVFASGDSLPLIGVKEGDRAFISQSGTEIGVDLEFNDRLSTAFFAGVGNAVDLGVTHLMVSILAYRPDIRRIRIYMEGLKPYEGRWLYNLICQATGEERSVSIYLGGIANEEGRKAAASHTAALCPARDVALASLPQAGATIERLYVDRPIRNQGRLLRLLLERTTAPIRRVAVVTNGGGQGVVASEGLRTVEFAGFSKATEVNLRSVIPEICSVSDPLDLTGLANDKHLVEATRLVLQDEGVDAVVVVYVPCAPLMRCSIYDKDIYSQCGLIALAGLGNGQDKPLIIVMPASKNNWPGLFRYLDEYYPLYVRLSPHAIKLIELANQQIRGQGFLSSSSVSSPVQASTEREDLIASIMNIFRIGEGLELSREDIEATLIEDASGYPIDTTDNPYRRRKKLPIVVALRGEIFKSCPLDEKPLLMAFVGRGVVDNSNLIYHPYSKGIVLEASRLANSMEVKNAIWEIPYHGKKTTFILQDKDNWIAVAALYGPEDIFRAELLMGKGGDRITRLGAEIAEPEGKSDEERIFVAYTMAMVTARLLGFAILDGPDMMRDAETKMGLQVKAALRTVRDINAHAKELKIKRIKPEDFLKVTTSDAQSEGGMPHLKWMVTSCGVVQGLVTALRFIRYAVRHPSDYSEAAVTFLKQLRINFRNLSCTIQGFGDVGSGIAKLLLTVLRLFHIKIRGFSNKYFAVYHPQELPEEFLAWAREKVEEDTESLTVDALCALEEGILRKLQGATIWVANLIDNKTSKPMFSAEEERCLRQRLGGFGIKVRIGGASIVDEVMYQRATILFLAAGSNAIRDITQLKRLQQKGIR
ncbi:MAG: acetate--CoA ligase family protein, partial [Candidatus Omnitrophota bacterium]